MAFSDYENSSDPCVAKANAQKNVINNSNAFTGIVIPSNGWQIEVLELPFHTSLEDIQMIFTKYGVIDKLAIVYKLKENSMNCYLSFEKEIDSLEAIKENGKKVGPNLISVLKYNSEVEKGNKRMRTEENGWTATTTSSDKSEWGSTAATSNANDSGWGASTSTNTSSGWGSGDTQGTDSWGAAPSSPARGRGRGRGGAGGRGGGRSCFNCGDEGHMSRECPKPKKGGSRSCFKCGEEGHMSRECPKGGGRSCFNCGEEGHMSRECSKPRAERGRGRGRGNSSGAGSWSNDNKSTSANTWGNDANSSSANSWGGNDGKDSATSGTTSSLDWD